MSSVNQGVMKTPILNSTETECRDRGVIAVLSHAVSAGWHTYNAVYRAVDHAH